ncbi:MAG: hypothetical protein AAGF12_19920 [Myxococcota bacterium]
MSGEGRIRLGDMLLRAGLIDDDQLQRALDAQKDTGMRLGEQLVALGYLSDVQMTQILSNQLSVPWVSLYHVEFSRELLNLIPAEVAERLRLVPVYVRRVRKQGDVLFVAMDDPTDATAMQEVSAAVGLPVKPMVAPPTEIDNAIRVYYFGERLRSPPSVPADDTDTERPDDVFESPATDAAEPSTTADRPAEASVAEASIADPSAAEASAPAGGPTQPAKPRMVTLTLLDGTTVRLPAPNASVDTPPSAPPRQEEALTASDLVAALLARAQGADVSDILPEERWEPLFATLLALLIRKGLIADWEFVDELNKRRG